MNSGRLVSSLLLLMFLASQVALAQVTTGTVSGTVTDSTGAVIPGATITLKNMETGISRTVTSDATGRYAAPRLGLGDYELTAEAPGFQTVVRSGVTLTVGREAAVDFAMQVGAVSEKITVTGEAPLIETTNATVSSLVDEKAMRDLPLNGRSYSDLTAIQPGVVSNMETLSTGNAAVYNGGGDSARRAIGGTGPQLSTYLLDGFEISTPSEGMAANSVLGQQLGVDAIREFTLLQNNFGAQFGRAAGGVVNAATRSGTDSLHGNLFEFMRNDKLDAIDFFTQPGQAKAALKRNQFGGSLGGPVKKDKAFFFANYEGVRVGASNPILGTTYTPETWTGRITGCPTGLTTCAPSQAIVTQTVIVNKDILEVWKPLLPLPNGNYRNQGVADYYRNTPYSASENYGLGRMDYQISSNDSLFGRLTKDESSRTDHFTLQTPQPFTGFQIGGYDLVAISETHTFSPTVLNTVRAGFTRRNDHLLGNYSQGGDQFPNPNPPLDPRLSPVKGVPLGLYGVPFVTIDGGTGAGLGLAGPAIFIDNTFEGGDSLLITKGKHSVAVGGDIKRYQENELNEPWVYGGGLSWDTTANFLTNNPFSDTQLIGTYSATTQLADVYRGFRQTYGAVYIQDDFQVRSGLTVNLGLRWEKVTAPVEVNGKLSIVQDVYTSSGFTPLDNETPLFSLSDNLKGFSPRVGLAWSPFGGQKMVIRSGFGLFKEMPLEYVWQLAITSPPYDTRVTVTRPQLKWPYPFADPALLKNQGEPLLTANSLVNPYTAQWNFSVERQLSQTLVLKANYLGTRGVDLFAINNPNQLPLTLVNGRPFTAATATLPNTAFNGYRYVANTGDQWYHALQIVAEKRTSAGISFNASYTWSRNIDTGGGTGTKCSEQVNGAASFSYFNSRDFAQDKGRSSLDVAQNFNLSYTYDLPFGQGRHWGNQLPKGLDYVVGGWTVNGTNSIRTGLPINIVMSARPDRCTSQGCGAHRPDLIPGGNNNPILPEWTPNRYFDPSQFVVPAAGFFGNVGKNTMTRPGQRVLNFSVYKVNQIGEGKNLEFRAEFFNFLNHPNFGFPSNTVFDGSGNPSPTAGRITTTSVSMRQIQFGLKLTF